MPASTSIFPLTRKVASHFTAGPAASGTEPGQPGARGAHAALILLGSHCAVLLGSLSGSVGSHSAGSGGVGPMKLRSGWVARLIARGPAHHPWPGPSPVVRRESEGQADPAGYEEQAPDRRDGPQRLRRRAGQGSAPRPSLSALRLSMAVSSVLGLPLPPPPCSPFPCLLAPVDPPALHASTSSWQS